MTSFSTDYIVDTTVEYGDIPEVLRSSKQHRSNFVVIPERSRRLLPFEKNWLCKESLGLNMGLNGEPRKAKTQVELMNLYKLYGSFFSKNMRAFNENGTVNCWGSPGKIPLADIEYVAKKIAERRMKQDEQSVQEVIAMFRELWRLRYEDVNSEEFVSLEGCSNSNNNSSNNNSKKKKKKKARNSNNNTSQRSCARDGSR